jgi:hypothetical protein
VPQEGLQGRLDMALGSARLVARQQFGAPDGDQILRREFDWTSPVQPDTSLVDEPNGPSKLLLHAIILSCYSHQGARVPSAMF